MLPLCFIHETAQVTAYAATCNCEDTSAPLSTRFNFGLITSLGGAEGEL
jgi:hypothetical protein